MARLEIDANVPGLIAELTNPIGPNQYMLVRGHAALALGRLGDARAVPYLAELMDDSEENVRMDAAFALGMMSGCDVRRPLLAALEDSSSIVRMAAAEGLGRRKVSSALRRLQDVAADDPDPEVRLYAAEALLELGDSGIAVRIPEILEAVAWRIRRRPRWKKLAEFAAG